MCTSGGSPCRATRSASSLVSGLRLRDRHAWTQSADHRQESDLALVHEAVHRRLDRAPERGGPRIVELGRHDADDGVGQPVEPHGPAEHVGPASEGSAPEPVAQDHHQLGTRPVVRGLERATDGRQGADHMEEVPRDHAPRRGHRLAAVLPDHSAQGGLHRGQLLERAAAGAPVAVVGVGHLEPGVGLVESERIERHQLLRRAERRRLKEHGSDRAEERGDRADAEGECENGGKRGGAVAQEAPKREAQVGEDHGWETSGGGPCARVDRAGAPTPATPVMPTASPPGISKCRL